ncbi:MAG: rod shape-determining protein MreC [Lachnospiraceae bacterium]|nr:rod shape-determining protein MreC [Lachnospiraceae bacterium]
MRRRRGTKFTIPSKYLLLILTVFCFIVMAVTFTTDFVAEPLNSAAGFVVVPFQRGVSRIGRWISSRSDELLELRDVLKENQELKERIDELTTEVNSLQQDKYELSNLRELYSLDNQYKDYQKIGARVISKDAGNWFHSFVIDKGSNDGIEVDMNVIAGSGLVGRVTEVSTNYAKVVSIIDDKSNVSAMVLSTSDRLIVSGDLQLMNDGYIRFSQLMDEDGEVKAGDKIVTSHISDKYLPGILIGYINQISIDENNLTSSGLLIPAVDFAHMEEVLVILTKKQ